MTKFGSHLFIVLIAFAFGASSSWADSEAPLEANTPNYKAGDAPAKTIKRSKPFKKKKVRKQVKKKKKQKAKKARKQAKKNKARLLKPKFKAKKKKANKNKEELPAPMPKSSS